MAMLGDFDPKKVSLLVNGYTVSGYAEGTFLKIERIDPELWKIHVGAHGEVGRTKNPNKAGKIIFTLQQQAPANAILDAFKNLSAPVAFGALNKSATNFAAAGANSWISKDPNVEFAMDKGIVEWEITCDELNKSFL